MKKIDIIILGIMLLGGLISAFLPNIQKHYKLLTPKELAYEINKNHYYTTDEIAKAIMTKDPSILLIDVRTPEQYAKYTLPGALNIPADSVFNPKNLRFINQDVYNVVLFSNGTSLAEQVRTKAISLGFKNLYVLEGGVNKWFETILQPEKPGDAEPEEAFEKYEFRKAAALFFGVGNSGEETQSSAPAPQVQINVPQNQSEPSGGGCE